MTESEICQALEKESPYVTLIGSREHHIATQLAGRRILRNERFGVLAGRTTARWVAGENWSQRTK